MSLRRWKVSRDENEKAIVDYLLATGHSVRRLNEPGVPDLIVGKRGCTHLVEIKKAPGPRGGTSHSKLTAAQVEFGRLWRGERHVASDGADLAKELELCRVRQRRGGKG
jgi:hypothetical protein